MCWSQKVQQSWTAGSADWKQESSITVESVLWSGTSYALCTLLLYGHFLVCVWCFIYRCVSVRACVVHILVAVKLHRVLPRFMFLVQSGEVTGSYILALRMKSILKRETWILRLCFSHLRTCSHCSKQHFKVAATLYLSLPSFISCSCFHW